MGRTFDREMDQIRRDALSCLNTSSKLKANLIEHLADRSKAIDRRRLLVTQESLILDDNSQRSLAQRTQLGDDWKSYTATITKLRKDFQLFVASRIGLANKLIELNKKVNKKGRMTVLESIITDLNKAEANLNEVISYIVACKAKQLQ